MKFKKMLKVMLENPDARFRSNACETRDQDLISICYWIKQAQKYPALELKSVLNMLDVADWQQEEGSDE